MTRRMYDAAYPPANPPATDAVAFYIGGDTPHVWDAAEINRQRARYRLPIYVRSNPTMSLLTGDAGRTINWLKAYKVPHGSVVALDLETAVHATYVRAFDAAVVSAGYKVLAYGSLGTIFSNPRTSGGYWAANPTGVAHMVRGAVATQWAFDTQLGHPWDLSDVADSVPLWDTKAPTPTPVPPPVPPPPSPPEDEEIDMAQRDLLPGLTAKTGLGMPPKTGGYSFVEFYTDNTYTDGKDIKAFPPVSLRVVVRRANGTWQHVEPFVVGRTPKDKTQGQWRIALDDKNATYVSVTRLSGTGDEEIQVAAY